MAAPRPGLVPVERRRLPQVHLRARIREAGRQHSHHRDRLSLKRYGAAHDPRVGPEHPAPESLADHDHARLSRLVLPGKERAAERRPDFEHLEEVRARRGDAHGLGLSAARGQARSAFLRVGRDARQRRGPVAPIVELGVRDRPERVVRPRRPDPHQRLGPREGERESGALAQRAQAVAQVLPQVRARAARAAAPARPRPALPRPRSHRRGPSSRALPPSRPAPPLPRSRRGRAPSRSTAPAPGSARRRCPPPGCRADPEAAASTSRARANHACRTCVTRAIAAANSCQLRRWASRAFWPAGVSR